MIAITVGIFLLATFVGLFNYLTPSGRVTVTGRVVEEKQQTVILKSNYEQATANAAELAVQVAYNAKRLADIQRLYASGANTEFKEQDTQVQYETVSAQLVAARRRNRASNSRSIPRSAASTRQSRSSRRNSITPPGKCRRRRCARPPTALSRLSH